MNEARAWASFVALTGGIVKLGEPFTEMHAHPEWEAVVQPLLPVYPHAARPLDLFDLKFPEVWWERIEREDHSWHVLGLFNWGLNEEVASTRQVPEAPRTKTVSLAALGQDASVPWLVFDAWDHTCRWVDDGIVEETLAPRTERILVLRGATPLPEIVATSRHLLGGAMEVTEEETAVAGDTVTLTALVDAPVGVPVTIFVSEGDYKLEQVLYPADATVGPPPCDGVLPIKLVPGESPASIGLRCTAP